MISIIRRQSTNLCRAFLILRRRSFANPRVLLRIIALATSRLRTCMVPAAFAEVTDLKPRQRAVAHADRLRPYPCERSEQSTYSGRDVWIASSLRSSQ